EKAARGASVDRESISRPRTFSQPVKPLEASASADQLAKSSLMSNTTRHTTDCQFIVQLDCD
ncbi:MAG TPA: hypothetical protein VGE52_15475, partial [Pirellulales bacterium]